MLLIILIYNLYIDFLCICIYCILTSFVYSFFFKQSLTLTKLRVYWKKDFYSFTLTKQYLHVVHEWPCLGLNHLNLFCTNIIYQKLVVTNLIYFFYSRLIQLRHLYKLKKMIIKNLYFQIPYWPIMKCMFIAVYQCFVVLFYVCW